MRSLPSLPPSLPSSRRSHARDRRAVDRRRLLSRVVDLLRQRAEDHLGESLGELPGGGCKWCCTRRGSRTTHWENGLLCLICFRKELWIFPHISCPAILSLPPLLGPREERIVRESNHVRALFWLEGGTVTRISLISYVKRSVMVQCSLSLRVSLFCGATHVLASRRSEASTALPNRRYRVTSGQIFNPLLAVVR